MKNQPHNTNFAPRVRTPTPEPPEIKDEDEDKDQLQEESNKESEKSKNEGTEEEKEQKGEKSKNEEEENNGMALNENGENGEPPAKKAKQEKAPKDLYKMPMFLPLEVDENGKEISMKVPEKMEKQKTQDFQVNQVIIRIKKLTNDIFPFTKIICVFFHFFLLRAGIWPGSVWPAKQSYGALAGHTEAVEGRGAIQRDQIQRQSGRAEGNVWKVMTTW